MTLSIEYLQSHGISKSVIDIWKENGIVNLLPLQEHSIREYGFLRGQNLVVFAPTSSGKTFVAEMAAINQLESNKKVIYLVPTKALAEEKYREFTKLYGKLGYDILISTRERPENDKKILDGNFNLLIAIYEKMKSYLVVKPQFLSQIGLIIIDELQMMGETNRGDIIDTMLTKIKLSPYKMQIIGLSAVLGDASHIANWMNSDLLIFNKRPVELREGIYNIADSCFYYTNFNNKQEAKEKFNFYLNSFKVSEDDNFYREIIFSLTKGLVSEYKEQVIIFVPMRSTTRNWAQALSSDFIYSPAEEAIKELEKFEDTYSKEILINVLNKSIAFHNSDLAWDLRHLIEHYFNKGDIKVLISTSTLGQGVNLAGRNAVIVHQMVSIDEWTGNYTLVPLSRHRFRNQGGRIARYFQGKEVEFGRSILVARNKEEVDTLKKEYIQSDFEPITLPLKNKSLDIYILDLIASKIYNTKEGITEFFLNTYTGTRYWSDNQGEFHKLIDDAISSCIDKKLIIKNEENKFTSSGIGKVAAINGINTLTLLRLYNFLISKVGEYISPLEILLAASFTPDADEFPINLTYRERNISEYLNYLKQVLSIENFNSLPHLKSFLDKEGGYTKEDISAIKKALLLNEWIGERETREIEDTFRIYSGTISNMASHFAWLIQTMALIASSMAMPKEIERNISKIADRLIYGVSEEGIELSRLRIPSLSRTYINTLTRNGFNTIASLASADEELLTSYIPPVVAKEIISVAKQIINPENAEEEDVDNSEEESNQVESIPNPDEEKELENLRLEIDPNSPQIVFINGRKVRLTKLPYYLLLTLAKKPGKCVSYQEIDSEVWVESKVEQQQIFAHKRTIINAFAKVIGSDLAQKTVISLSGSGLMLALKAKQITIYGNDKSD